MRNHSNQATPHDCTLVNQRSALWVLQDGFTLTIELRVWLLKKESLSDRSNLLRKRDDIGLLIYCEVPLREYSSNLSSLTHQKWKNCNISDIITAVFNPSLLLTGASSPWRTCRTDVFQSGRDSP